MPSMTGFVDFNPEQDIPRLDGKVIFVTGGTAGLGKASIQALVKRGASHVYFTGRNAEAGNTLINEMKKTHPSVGLTFLEMDFLSLASVKKGCDSFVHDRLDLLMCNAGIMFKPPALSQDGYEATFATNHLAHALIIKKLLPTLLKTAETPNSDVRLISLTSEGWAGHPKEGVNFSTLQTTQNALFGKLTRYGQSKLANIVYTAEVARRHPQIMCASVHPGVVKTDLVNNLSLSEKALVYGANWLMGVTLMEEDQGCLSQLWVAAGARRDQLVNGAYYRPVGVQSNSGLDKIATSQEFATKLWTWTDDALAKAL
ncbi:putative short-chain dehydrogenase [Xylaria bambusicola]|uniref:putative short-chain dehydrogenase n=1 Tax=Xylaria bambusicola TaxID=326684 RepID=UPI00200731E8|nr:putative short-chain dehydrogenase [Xylaria bambusicola]KAI0503259.1 putative short-chain dehydrogenase [Xylaria bambusicola]